MKKKLLSLMLMICITFPFAATLVACDNNNNPPAHTCTAETEWESDDTHHWHKCKDDDCELILNKAEHEFATTSETSATVDADGEKVETCSTCQKVKRTTIPKLVQTKNEMIAMLANAVKKENYSGEIQETYYYEKTSDDSMIAPAETPEKETDYLAKKSDGTLVKYTINHNKPDEFEGDYITDIEYVKAVENDNIHHWLKLSDEETPALFIASETKVGDNYSKNYAINSIAENLDYLLEINSETTMNSVLKDTLAFYIDIYQNLLAKNSIIFDYDKDDIAVAVDVTYSDGVYTAVGTITLSENDITYEGTPTIKFKDFKVEFEVEYTSSIVKRNDSKFIYNVEQGGNTEEFYIINNVSYSKTTDSMHFLMAEEMLSESTYNGSIEDATETLTVYVNNVLYTTEEIPFETAVNETLDEILFTLLEIEDYSTITTMINGEEYDSSTDIIVEDYIGTSVYITIEPIENYSLIMTSYVFVEENLNIEIYRVNTIEMVETNSGSHTIDPTGPNPDYDPDYNPDASETIEYDEVKLNGQIITDPENLTFEVVESEYYIELILYIDLSGLLG